MRARICSNWCAGKRTETAGNSEVQHRRADLFPALAQPVLPNLVVQRRSEDAQRFGAAREAAVGAAQGVGDEGAFEGFDGLGERARAFLDGAAERRCAALDAERSLLSLLISLSRSSSRSPSLSLSQSLSLRDEAKRLKP